jgi:hypothetical protein
MSRRKFRIIVVFILCFALGYFNDLLLPYYCQFIGKTEFLLGLAFVVIAILLFVHHKNRERIEYLQGRNVELDEYRYKYHNLAKKCAENAKRKK